LDTKIAAALLPKLSHFEQSSDPELVAGALLAGLALGRAATPLVLRRSLGHASSAVRVAALAVIETQPSPSYLPVIKPLLQEADPDTRAGAVRAIASIAEASGQEALARAWLAPMTQDTSAAVRKALAEAGRLG
jgi:HEAT repeat protein